MSVTTVRLQPELESGLEAMADKLNRSKSWLINQALREYLEREEQALSRWLETLTAMESVAVADLVRLRHFIAENDPGAASRLAAELVSRIGNLREFPHIGIDVTPAPAPRVVRDMVFGRYIVRYAAQAESVVVLCIWHEKENER